jgi:hypothetical protein
MGLDPNDPCVDLALVRDPYMRERPRLAGSPQVELDGLGSIDWASLFDGVRDGAVRSDILASAVQ